MALDRCDALVAAIFDKAAELAGSSGTARDPATVPALLGLDGRRYLGFRAVVRKARAGGEITERDALKAFAFVLEARLAESADLTRSVRRAITADRARRRRSSGASTRS